MTSRILIGDCRDRLKELPDASVDSVVCDPPYHLIAGGFNLRTMKRNGAGTLNVERAEGRGLKGFMGQTWDGGDVAFQPETWAEVLRVLKPGGHLIAFSGTRTYHRMVCAIEDAGFEIRDQLAWVYGSGFPKSHDVSKQIDKAAGAEREVVGPSQFANRGRRTDNKVYGEATPSAAEVVTLPATESAREWQGWGTALKPSWEPICLARKPLIGTVAANVLAHGTGALNIDATRIATDELTPRNNNNTETIYKKGFEGTPKTIEPSPLGRWPANLCHDGSEEVLAGFPDAAGCKPHVITASDATAQRNKEKGWGSVSVPKQKFAGFDDSGSAARFFYCAKATTDERGEGNNHPTVKPVALMRWLCRLVTPKGGTVLDPFMGSGSTLLAAEAEQFNAIGCEMSPEYAAIAEKRIRDAAGMFADVVIDRGLEEAA